MIELINIINASRGKNSKGEPNAAFSVSEQLLDSHDSVKVIREQVITESEIDVVLNGDYIMFDCKFSNPSSPELRVLWNYLEKFGKNQNDFFDKSDSPILNFVVLPLEFSGEYSYTLINPVCWTLQPSMPGAPIDTIRILFEKEALNVFASNEINKKEIDAEIEKEEYERNRLEEVERRKETEHEDYLNKLNQKFNSR